MFIIHTKSLVALIDLGFRQRTKTPDNCMAYGLTTWSEPMIFQSDFFFVIQGAKNARLSILPVMGRHRLCDKWC